MIEGLRALAERYRSLSYNCRYSSMNSFECGSILYGALTKELERLDILVLESSAPFLVLSLDAIIKKVQSVKSPTWYSSNRRDLCIGTIPSHSCSLKTDLDIVIASLNQKTKGLQLERESYREVQG